MASSTSYPCCFKAVHNGFQVGFFQAEKVRPFISLGGAQGHVDDLASRGFDEPGGRVQGLGSVLNEQVQAGGALEQAQHGDKGGDQVLHGDDPHEPVPFHHGHTADFMFVDQAGRFFHLGVRGDAQRGLYHDIAHLDLFQHGSQEDFPQVPGGDPAHHAVFFHDREVPDLVFLHQL